MIINTKKTQEIREIKLFFLKDKIDNPLAKLRKKERNIQISKIRDGKRKDYK
jgi:hypothetical protein